MDILFKDFFVSALVLRFKIKLKKKKLPDAFKRLANIQTKVTTLVLLK